MDWCAVRGGQYDTVLRLYTTIWVMRQSDCHSIWCLWSLSLPLWQDLHHCHDAPGKTNWHTREETEVWPGKVWVIPPDLFFLACDWKTPDFNYTLNVKNKKRINQHTDWADTGQSYFISNKMVNLPSRCTLNCSEAFKCLIGCEMSNQ